MGLTSVKKRIPEGWQFYNADFSSKASGRGPGHVMLTRDTAGQTTWFSLQQEEQDVTQLYVSGEGHTFEEALAHAAKAATAINVKEANGV